MAHYRIYEYPPLASNETASPNRTTALYFGNPHWTCSVFEVLGETPQRFLIRPIDGDERHFKRDGQRRLFAEKTTRGFTKQTDDLDEALAYCERRLTAWKAECAKRDAAAAPLFAEIARLEALVREANAARDEALPRIIAACTQPATEPLTALAETS